MPKLAKKNLKSLCEIPGPQEVKGKGNVEGDLAHYQMLIHKQYGPVVKFKLDAKTLVVSTTDVLALKACSNIFDKPEPLYQFLEPLMGKLMFLPIQANKKLRKFMIDKFSPTLVRKKFPELLNQLDQEIDDWLAWGEKTDGVISIQERVRALAMRMTVTLVCGMDFLESGKLGKSIHTALEELLKLQYNREHKQGEKLNEALKYINDTVNQFIHERRRLAPQSSEDRVFLDELMLETQDVEDVRNITKEILMASYHTVASSVAWTLYAITAHSDVAKKVYREIDLLPKNTPFDFQNLFKLNYLSDVIKESARIYPPGPYTARQATENLEIGGYLIPAGTTIFYPIWAVHMDPEYWPEPEKFDPKRFSTHYNKLAFLPFGFGARACPGANIANVQVLLILTRMLQKLDLQAIPNFQPVIRENFVLISSNEIQLRVSSRIKHNRDKNFFVCAVALGVLMLAVGYGDRKTIALVCFGLVASFAYRKNIYAMSRGLTFFGRRQPLREQKEEARHYLMPVKAVNMGKA